MNCSMYYNGEEVVSISIDAVLCQYEISIFETCKLKGSMQAVWASLSVVYTDLFFKISFEFNLP